jgi:hypothetical protein
MVILFLLFIFNTTMGFFLNPHLSFYSCEKCNVIISKVHYVSNFFFKFILISNMIPTKVQCNIDHLNCNNLNVQYDYIYNLNSFTI